MPTAYVIQLFLFHNFTLLNEYCLTRPLPLRKKLKAYIKKIIFKKTEVSNGLWVLDQWSQGYFHWFTEVLPRLISANSIYNNYAVLIPEEWEKISFIKESMIIFNRKILFYSLRKKIKVRNIVAPSHLLPAQFDPEQILKVRQKFREYDEFNSVADQNVYISRRKSKRRYITNEDSVKELLELWGFKIVYMEDLDFQQQRKLMYQTDILISNHGAGLTNMIFLQDNRKIIELKSDSDDINNCYFNLARALNHSYFYIINNADSKKVQEANIYVNIKQLEELLIELDK